jgi:hypothetical protein
MVSFGHALQQMNADDRRRGHDLDLIKHSRKTQVRRPAEKIVQ